MFGQLQNSPHKELKHVCMCKQCYRPALKTSLAKHLKGWQADLYKELVKAPISTSLNSYTRWPNNQLFLISVSASCWPVCTFCLFNSQSRVFCTPVFLSHRDTWTQSQELDSLSGFICCCWSAVSRVAEIWPRWFRSSFSLSGTSQCVSVCFLESVCVNSMCFYSSIINQTSFKMEGILSDLLITNSSHLNVYSNH